MTLTELWDQYQRYTRDATELARKLGFAAGAICWFFKDAQTGFPLLILWALLWLVGFFVTDAAQSLAAAVVYRRWLHAQEAKRYAETGGIAGEYNKPRWLDYPAFTLYWVKFALLFISFFCIASELLRRQSLM